MEGTPSIRRWRRLLLGGLAATLLMLAGLYWLGKMGREPRRKPQDTGVGLGSGDTTLAGQGFDYTLNQGDRPAFRIRGAQIRSDRDDNVELEEVGLTVFRGDGSRYELQAETALYNRETSDATLLGGVTLLGPNGIALTTSGLELKRRAREIASMAPVSFQFGGDLSGHADRLKAVIPSEFFVMAGDVRVESVGREVPISLSAIRVGFERRPGMVRAEGDVVMRQGASTIFARRLAGKLTEDEKGLEFLRANWDVHGELAPRTAGAAPIHFQGDGVGVEFDTEGSSPRRVRLTGSPVAIDSKHGIDARTLQATEIVARFEDGELRSAEATGNVAVRAEAGKAVRTATARRAEAAFLGSGLVSVTLIEEVALDDGRIKARGDRAYLDLVAERGELFGAPAHASSERGELDAPHIVSSRDRGGLVKADGGVQALVTPRAGRSSFTGTPLGAGTGPIRVEAQEAFWQDSPPTFTFQGGVRAWRGDNLLVAGQVQGNELLGELAASGMVQTVWIPEKVQAQSELAPARGPVQVDADNLLYRKGTHEAIYSGSVRITQAGRRVMSDEARLELDANDRIKSLVCTGKVRLEDPERDRRVSGERAVYDIAAGTIVVTGQPVVLEDPVRGRAEGSRLIYQLGDGAVRLLAAEDTASEGATP